jgi:hypothetical protein
VSTADEVRLIASAVYQAQRHEAWALGWAATEVSYPPARFHPFAVDKAESCAENARRFWVKAVAALVGGGS